MNLGEFETAISGSLTLSKLLLAMLSMPLGANGASTPAQAAAPVASHVSPISITNPIFKDGDHIPVEFTCAAGPNMHSPELNWSGIPAEATSLVVYFHDLDPHPNGGIDDVLHWMAWNIPAGAKGLPAGVKPTTDAIPGGIQGLNTHATVGYFGPCPPPGQPDHHYVFEVFALRKTLQLPEKASRNDLMGAMNGSIVGHGVMIALFSRKP